MTSGRQHLIVRNECIRKDFKELMAEGLRSQNIYEKLAEKYFMSPFTINDIVWKNGIYK